MISFHHVLFICVTHCDVTQRSAQNITSQAPSQLGMFSRGARVIWCSHVLHVPRLTQATLFRHKVDLWPSDLWGHECGSKGGGNLATEESCGHAGRVKLLKTHREKIPLSRLYNGTGHECAWCCNNSCPGRLGKWDWTGWNWFPMYLEEVTERERECACALAGVFRFLVLNTNPTSQSPTLLQSRGSIRSRDSFLHTAG